MGHFKKAIFRSANRSIAYSIRELKLMPSSQNSEIIAHKIWFVSPFTILSSFEKRVQKRERSNKSHKERFICLNAAEKSWMNFCNAGKCPSAFPLLISTSQTLLWLCYKSRSAQVSGQKKLASPSPWLLRQIGTRSRERISPRVHSCEQKMLWNKNYWCSGNVSTQILLSIWSSEIHLSLCNLKI